MGDNSLARRLGVSLDEAKAKVAKYKNTYPAVDRFMKEAVEEGRKYGCSFTVLGRRRNIPMIVSDDRGERSRGERLAVNTTIQGCIPAATRILTKEGYIPIGDAPDHGTVWTGTDWKSYTRLNRGAAELAELYLDNGQILRCDTRHSVLVDNGNTYEFVHYSDLKAGDAVCMSMARPLEFGRSHAHPDHYYWMGFALGNAWSSGTDNHRNCMTVTFGDRKGRYKKEEKAEQFVKYVTEYFTIPTQRPQVHDNKINVRVEREAFKEFLCSLGYAWGSHAAEKRLPSTIWTSSLECRKALLTGFLDADGYVGVSTPNIHLCQKSILLELQQIFRTCGVESKLRGPYVAAWRLDLVGSQCTRHLGYGQYKRQSIGSMRAPVQAVSSALLANAGTTRSHAVIRSRMKRTGVICVYTLADMLGETGASSELYATRTLLDKKALGVTETTYTLSVDDPLHRFDSEGVISKNSAADVVRMAQINIDNCGLVEYYDCHPTLQVHDELVFEVAESNVEASIEEIKESMEHPFARELFCPLTVEIGSGDSWGEAK